jgi:hypothetical protein
VAGSGCVVCGSLTCTSHPEIDHYEDYPFLPGGRPRVPGKDKIDYVIAPHAVSGKGKDAGRKIYGAGDKVPMADAVKYGLAKGPAKEPAKPAPKGKRRTTARARKPEQDRARKPADNR